jgi:pyrimidine operon attenuation protein/uracil phosphoribosyltransferase
MVFVGIPTRGVPLAERLARRVGELTGTEAPAGTLDISGHRDDRPAPPGEKGPALPFAVTGKTVVLVDDVLHTGRTARAGLDALVDAGRPASVRLVTLVDRGHRQLPVRADHVGKNLPTSEDQRVRVRVEEIDGVDEVVIEEVRA